MFAFHKIFFIRTKQKFNFWTPAERKQLTSKIFCCYCCCKRSAAPTTQQQFAAAVNSTKRAEEFSNYQPENISKSELSTLKEIRKSWMAIKTENNTHKTKKKQRRVPFSLDLFCCFEFFAIVDEHYEPFKWGATLRECQAAMCFFCSLLDLVGINFDRINYIFNSQ